VRILVEADVDAELSLNFFLIDELNTESRFVFEEIFAVRAAAPIAKTFYGLRPNTKYAVHLGGCNSQETLLRYATFTTLPLDMTSSASSTTSSSISKSSPPRILFSHSGRVDRLAPGEVNMWREMEDIVKSAQDESAQTGQINDYAGGAVHMVIHLGDFLNIDATLRSRVVELLDVLLRDDTSIETWDAHLRETETAIRDAYRRALSSSDVQYLLRRCGHVFLAGQGEAGMITSSLLGMNPPLAPPSSEAQSKAEVGKEEESGGVKLGYKAAKKAREEADAKAAAELAALAPKEPRKRGEVKDDFIDTPEDLASPSVGGTARRQREEVKISVDSRTRVQEELRILLLGSIVRMARRVSWSYMRQLWDDDYESLVNEEAQIEASQRAVLRTRKVLQTKELLLSHLTKTHKKIVREFGEEYKASERVAERSKFVQLEVDELQQKLRDLLEESSVIISSVKEPPNGACLDLGGLVLVLIETAWGWLGRDGLAMTLYNRDIPISAAISSQLDMHLLEGGEESSEKVTVKAQLRTVICACAASLLPTQVLPPLLAPDEPQPFKPASLDTGKFLRSLALWQQRMPERAVLLASACQAYSTDGFASPYVPNNDAAGGGQAESKESGKELEGWNGDRCKLRLVLVGPMDKKSKPRGNAKYGQDESSPPMVPLVDAVTKFAAEYDSGSSCSRRSFWDVVHHTASPPKAPTETTPGVAMGNAGFHVRIVSDQRQPVNVTIGPVIGRVTASSACVMLETAEDCHVELLCVDQVTGVEFASSHLAKKLRPSLFVFDGLVAERAYDVFLSGPTRREHAERKLVIDRSLVRGSFTTPKRGGMTHEEQVDQQLATSLRDHVEGQGLAGGSSTFSIMDEGTAGGASGTSIEKERVSMLASQTMSVDSISGAPSSSCALRVLVVGANKPSWLRLLPHVDQEEADESALGTDRKHLLGGISLCKSVVDVTSRAWGGVGLVLHCGYSVDLCSSLDATLGMLARAEESSRQGQVLSEDVEKLLFLAEDSLRTAYRMHWGASMTRPLLAHCSHLVVASPMLDVLCALNASTLRQLARDLSPFAMKHLLEMVSNLDTEYQKVLWGLELPADSLFRAHFVAGGSVAVFSVHLRTINAQDNFGTSEDGLLPDPWFASLSALLGQGQSAGSAMNNQEHLLDTLILVSPLAIVADDAALIEGTFLSGGVRGLAFSPSETLRLLDLLSTWLEEYPGREVIIVCGGVSVGHTTTITCDLLYQGGNFGASSEEHISAAGGAQLTDAEGGSGEMSGEASAALGESKEQHYQKEEQQQRQQQQRPPVTIRQICVGSFIGVPGDDPPIEEGHLFSQQRRFRYLHDAFNRTPHCGLVEVGDNRSIQRPEDFQRANIELCDKMRMEQLLEANGNGALRNETVSSIWKSTKAHLSTRSKKGQNPGSLDEDAIALSKAVTRALGASAVKPLFQQVHDGFVEGAFELPLDDGSAMEESFMAASRVLLDGLPQRSRQICPYPSSLALRLVWGKFLLSAAAQMDAKAKGGAASTSNDFSAIADAATFSTTPAQFVCASVCADVAFLTSFICEAVETQALLEYFSIQSGILEYE